MNKIKIILLVIIILIYRILYKRINKLKKGDNGK